MKIKFFVDIGWAGCSTDEVHEFDDDVSDEDLNSFAQELGNEWASSWEGDERLGVEWDDGEATEEFYNNVDTWWEVVND